MSKLQWMDAVRRCTDIPPGQRLVILHIGATATPQGTDAWRANATVAAELGVSLDTVKRARKAAVDHGLLEVTRPAPKGAGNTHTTEYRLINGCSGATIYEKNRGKTTPEIGAARATNRGKTTPEIGAGEGHPSVISSVSSSVITSGARAHDKEMTPAGRREEEKEEIVWCYEHTQPEHICDECHANVPDECPRCGDPSALCYCHDANPKRWIVDADEEVPF